MVRLLNTRFIENGIAALIAAAAFIVYLTTLCTTTNFIDSGELSTVAYTLGIAHPTGYPLFTLIGWIFAHLPLSLRVIYKLNMMAAFFCAMALFVFFRFLAFFLRILSNRGTKSKQPHMLSIVLPSLVGTLLLGFSETFWSQATSIEVYSVHCFFLALLLLLFMRAMQKEGEEDNRSIHTRSRWYAFAFVLGLAFTNHMTTILLAPAFLYLYFSTYRFSESSWKRLGRLAIPFLLGFSLYLYLPLRASEHPIMNWGNPIDLERFSWHFTGKQYRVWIFSSTESAMKQLQYFIDTLPPEFAYVPLLLAVIGLWSLLKGNRTLMIWTILLFLGCILYAINYDIHDIDSYFLLAYFTIAIWCAVGVHYLIITIRKVHMQSIIAVVSLVLACVVAFVNYPKVDDSRTLLVEDYTRDMLKSVAHGGIVISYQWDYFVSAVYYFQLVENERQDVVVIDKELLRRSWYFKQLENRYPWLIQQSKKEVDKFLVELQKFERGFTYDPNLIELRYNEVIHSFIEENYRNRPVYATPEIEPEYTSGYNRVPSGLAFILYSDTLSHEAHMPQFLFHKPTRSDRYVDGLLSQYAKSYVNHAIYSNLKGNKDIALQYIDKALQIQPEMPEAIDVKDRITRRK
ncbi:MAG: DUF2723 domain-containing protein [Ignavibacteriae bacterium]|nr:DUF2723 domain-containing protein [Ignavibacteriota bacterium]